MVEEEEGISHTPRSFRAIERKTVSYGNGIKPFLRVKHGDRRKTETKTEIGNLSFSGFIVKRLTEGTKSRDKRGV